MAEEKIKQSVLEKKNAKSNTEIEEDIHVKKRICYYSHGSLSQSGHRTREEEKSRKESAGKRRSDEENRIVHISRQNQAKKRTREET